MIPIRRKRLNLYSRSTLPHNAEPRIATEHEMKKLYIKTYGCQMNVYDSARMADLLAPLGYAPVETAEAADMVILNTCHIREKATEKVYSELGKLKQLKTRRAQAGTPMLVAVAGRRVQASGAENMGGQRAVD